MSHRTINNRLAWWGPVVVDVLEVDDPVCPLFLTFDEDSSSFTFDSYCPTFQLAEEDTPFPLFSYDSLYHKFSSIYLTMDQEN